VDRDELQVVRRVLRSYRNRQNLNMCVLIWGGFRVVNVLSYIYTDETTMSLSV
jgi:hypothetical protein